MAASRAAYMPVWANIALPAFDVSRGAFEYGFKLERAAVRARDTLFGFFRYGGENVVFLVAFRAAQIVKWHKRQSFSYNVFSSAASNARSSSAPRLGGPLSRPPPLRIFRAAWRWCSKASMLSSVYTDVV